MIFLRFNTIIYFDKVAVGLRYISGLVISHFKVILSSMFRSLVGLEV